MRLPRVALIFCLMVSGPTFAQESDVAQYFRVIAEVGPQGAGSEAARTAAASLRQRGMEIMPDVLDALDTENIVAANWVRTVLDDILRRELASPQPQVPVGEFKAFVLSPARNGRARRLLLEIIERQEPEFFASQVDGLLSDREFRPDAISALLKRADVAKKEGELDVAKDQYRRAFENAREADQIREAAGRLRGVGETVSIVDHMGFLIDWYLVGPFDAPEYSGFDKEFPPQTTPFAVDQTFSGKDDAELHWTRHQTEDTFGQLNLIKAIASTREAVGYAYTEVISPKDQDVQLRCGADDNISVWLNGKKIFGRNQWLNGTRLDRFTADAHLVEGRNVVLVKICQGPQHKNPEVPNNWSMQLRFCDVEGAAVGLKSALPPAKETAE